MEYSITVKASDKEMEIFARAMHTSEAIEEFLNESRRKLNYPNGESHDWLGGYSQAVKDLKTILNGG